MSDPQPIRETIHAATSDNGIAGGESPPTFASEVERLAQEFRSRLTAAASEAEASLRHDVASHLEQEFDEKFNAGISMVRREMELELEEARTKWNQEREKLNHEIEELLQITDVGRIRSEILTTERALARVGDEVRTMVEDANVRLSDVMRKKSEQAELTSYLRGLRSAHGSENQAD